jgi:hypothetical protein
VDAPDNLRDNCVADCSHSLSLVVRLEEGDNNILRLVCEAVGFVNVLCSVGPSKSEVLQLEAGGCAGPLICLQQQIEEVTCLP